MRGKQKGNETGKTDFIRKDARYGHIFKPIEWKR